jgi:cytochrome c-type biogenesis protein CcmE
MAKIAGKTRQGPCLMPKMSKKRMRLYGLFLFLLGLGAAVTLVLFALRDNLSYFRTPTEIISGNYPEHASGRAFRLGGLVEKGSLTHKNGTITFTVTDLKHNLTVRYSGVMPDLFREGQGVVAEGKMNGGVFVATTLLAKHDEKYMPPEVARELKQ